MNAKHTPTPWGVWLNHRICPEPQPGQFTSETIATVDNDANAAFIVRAVNSYDALVEALEFYANRDNWKDEESGIGTHPGEAIDYGATARAALAAAKGE